MYVVTLMTDAAAAASFGLPPWTTRTPTQVYAGATLYTNLALMLSVAVNAPSSWPVLVYVGLRCAREPAFLST